MFKKRNKKIFSFLIIFTLTAGLVFPLQPYKASATGIHMLLFWDGGAAPSGWSIVTTYDGKFPRGESAANFGTTGGSSTHTPTTASVVNNGSSAGFTATGATADSAYVHTHTSLSGTIGSASNLIVHKGLKLIQFDAGIPVSIPTGTIAIFDASAPAGWTRQSALDGNMIMASSTTGTSYGSDTHTHTITWSSLSAATESSLGNSNSQGATTGHTHTAPAAGATASGTYLPPYIEVVIAKADSATYSLPNDMIAMFDADPGSAWTINSGSGQAFYQQFIRGASAYNGTSAGSATHTHASVTSGVSGNASAKSKGSTTGGTAISGPTHNHTLTATFNSVDNTPPYFNVVYAKKNTNIAPNAPTQNSPADAATGVSLTPTFTMTGTDNDQDNLGYKVTIYSNSGCTTVVQTNDQAVSSTGWTGTDKTCSAAPTACYASSTQASFLTQTPLSGSTQYWWRASAKDPDGSATFTNSSTCNTFTTMASASLTFLVSSNDFPTLTPGSPVFATTTLSVDTDNSTGWNVTVLRDDSDTAIDLNTDAAINITDQTAWVPGAATTTVGNAVRISSLDSSGDVLGLRAMTASGTVSFISTSWWGTTDSYVDSATSLWAGFPTTAKKVGESSVSSGGSAKLNTMLYYLDVASTQPTGTYSGGITYTATMNP